MRAVKLAYDVVYPDGSCQRNLPPIILLHGMTDFRKTWTGFSTELAKATGRIVYAYDARNHGESEWSDEFNFDILAWDLKRFMDDMGISKAIILGHSMGGKTALTFALKEPQRVDKLIVEDMAARNWSTERVSFNIVGQFIMMLKESLKSIPQGATADEARKAVIDFLSPILATRGSMNKMEYYITLKATNDGHYTWHANLDVLEDVVVNLEKLNQEISGVYMGDTLFLYGTESFMKVERDHLIPKLFPKSQIIPIEGGDHNLHMERSKEYFEKVASFILGPETLNSKY